MKRSREREKRADRISAYYCGGKSFKNGLMKVVSVSRVFEGYTASRIKELLDEDKVFTNFYK